MHSAIQRGYPDQKLRKKEKKELLDKSRGDGEDWEGPNPDDYVNISLPGWLAVEEMLNGVRG